MPARHRPRPLAAFIVALAGACCQSGVALAAGQTGPLARYVPVQDQLCNYCQDFSARMFPARLVSTRYRPGVGYPASAGPSDDRTRDRGHAEAALSGIAAPPDR